MICYRLRCAHDHVFEGWYKDSSTFAMLRQKNLLNCPECGTSSVDQAPMAPAIVGRAPERLPQSDPTPTPDMAAPPAPVAGQMPPGLPDAMLSALRDVRRTIEENCENMGNRFADEALRIHYGEAPERGIYGEMSQSQREELEEEGVAFQNVPWVRDTDS
ncbi:MAG: DUF1178 family protein [Acetobacter fabarum]|jgi:hypothetical protein|uniref:DUF1178 domain-containing protein n=1 Tax=Acetobacter fabarum TaxID=483199 RepID=A0A269Y140_9PROT|nr:DUF1178 family protein [Acetobacter fabarum]MCH4026767.1 DUF1178 family protein [Acetobacter fabarum]MCH4056171.1 DUF1178 family protein [Acetobacter fabarum]MCH4085372.1 DUF1178 family protein [Acetobacter fabarum]MCH4127084.1 DUF1178 family protein [Acetobacter fabarum]MCH4137385.1 DUF1178 family protein [Acetobacter fabarum]